MVKTKTLTQRVADLEKEIAELRKDVDFQLMDFSKTQGVVSVHSIWLEDIRERLDALEREENLLPPTLSPEEEKRAEEIEREWRGY